MRQMTYEELKASHTDLVGALGRLCHAYVRTLESGRDRIISLGGDCDSVEVMEKQDPALREARAALERAKASG